MGRIKNFILWKYGRETSVYVIFCLLIIAFIFLTPKRWFVRERPANQTTRLTFKASELVADKSVLQERVRQLSGDPEAEVVSFRETKNAAGETVYEVEIR